MLRTGATGDVRSAPTQGVTASGGAVMSDSLAAAAEVARDVLRTRRRRNMLFGDDLFGEPAWDIILELFVAKAEGRQMTVKSACIGANVPMSTALRRVTMLTDKTIIRKFRRPGGARFWLELDDEAARNVERVLLEMGSILVD